MVGPAMIYDETQMIVIQPGAVARILQSHIIIDLGSKPLEAVPELAPRIDEPLTEDPIQLSIMSNRFMGIAEQMGLTLQKTSVSVNIKERLDFSCALFGVRSLTLPYHHILTTPSLTVVSSPMPLTFQFTWGAWNIASASSMNYTRIIFVPGMSSFLIRKFHFRMLSPHSNLLVGLWLAGLICLTSP